MTRFKMSLLGLALFALGLALVSTSARAQTNAENRAFFDSCGGCHTIGDVARSRSVGPTLTNVFGARAASQRDFDYSPALEEAGEDGLVWTREVLDAFIADPRGYLRGNRMAYAGLRDPDMRRMVINYLRNVARSGGDPELRSETR
ncbi:MAG: cytochrome c family protein [Pseudomonadota bacterium]